jgi:putative transposase
MMDLSFKTENARFAFGRHDRVTIEGASYSVCSYNEEGYVLTRDDATRLSVAFGHDQLSRLASARRIHVERDHFLPEQARRRLTSSTVKISTLSGKAAARVSKRDAYCEAFAELYRDGQIQATDESIRANMRTLMGAAMAYVDNLNRFGADRIDVSTDLSQPPSPRTLRRWLQARRQGGVQGLVDTMHRRGNRGSTMGPESVGLMMKYVRGYLHAEKPTVQIIHERVLVAFADRNADRAEQGLDPLVVPSRETVRRAIRALDPYEVELARNGPAAARKKFRPVSTGLNLTRPLERVEIDEWTVDLITIMRTTELYEILTEEEKLALGLDGSKARWALTVAICCTTRCIVGMTLSRTPKGEAAARTLEMVVSNKGQWADAVGALSSWDMHGVPELVVTDGGPAFKAERFRYSCADLGIAFEIATNGVPEVRGTIERVFGTLARDLMPRLSGRTFSDVIAKGDRDPRDRAALTVDDLTFALIRWVVDIYHNTPHRGLEGEAPLACWRRLSQRYGVQPPPDMEQTRLVFGERLERRLDHTGVTMLGVRYHSEKLATWMLRRDPQSVELRWHPMDIGAVAVRLGAEWHTVPAVDTSLDGVPARTWLTAVRHVRAGAPKSRRTDMSAVRGAIKAIEARTGQSMMAAGLNLEDWSEETVDREERKLFEGNTFFEAAPPARDGSGPGRAIPDLSDVTGEIPPHVKDEDGATPAPRHSRTSAKSKLNIKEK